MAKKQAQIGEVFEIKTPAGFAYVQYTHDTEGMGELVRVLPGLHPERPDITKLAQQKELYFIFYTLKYALRDGVITFVSNESIPVWARLFPVMRHRAPFDDGWLIGDGYEGMTPQNIRRMLKVHDLTPEQKKISTSSLCSHAALVKRLARGWTPELDEEFQQADILAAAERRKSKKDEEPKARTADESLEHYLYFAKKPNAERAAQRLRAKDWTVEVKRGADGENWLVLAKQPAPIEDDIENVREELEQLADELGGEYDGWGAAVNGPKPDLQ